MDELSKELKKLLGTILAKLKKELYDYFDMLPKIIFSREVKEILNVPRYEILKSFSLTNEKLDDPLYIPEILLLAEHVKENNFNYFTGKWNTYGYDHYKRGYILKDLIEELEPVSKGIKQNRINEARKILNKAKIEMSSNKFTPKPQFIDENFELYDLPHFNDTKQSINEAYNHDELYKILPILIRRLFENISYYIFRDGLDNSHREFCYNKHKNRPRDFSDLIFLLNILKGNVLNQYCTETINEGTIEVLDEIRKVGNRAVHEILAVVNKGFIEEWKKEKIPLVLKPLIVLYKNIKDTKIEITDENILKKIRNEFNFKIDELELKDEISSHFKTIFNFLEKLFSEEGVSINDIRFITAYIENNSKDLINYLKFHREQTTPTSVQNYYFLEGRYQISFKLNSKPKMKITKENVILWIPSDSEEIHENFKNLHTDVLRHLKEEFGINVID